MLNSKTSIALAVLTAIAHHGNASQPVGASALVAHYKLSSRALEPTLQILSRLKLVQAARGSRGGYYITQPERICVRKVIELLQPDTLARQPLSVFDLPVESALRPAREAFLKTCETITIAGLAQRAAEQGITRVLEEMLDFSI